MEELGIAGATIDYRSAVIGNGDSLATNGVISFVNDTAATAGCAPGQKTKTCAQAMKKAPGAAADVPVYEEARFVIRDGAGTIHHHHLIIIFVVVIVIVVAEETLWSHKGSSRVSK